MSLRPSTCIVTYNGLDGACSAAMLLLKYPKAEIQVTSAARIAQTLQYLVEHRKLTHEIFICGVGAKCDAKELGKWGVLLKTRGATLTWFCGRGYLLPQMDQLSAFANCQFMKTGSDTNTEVIHQFLGMAPGHMEARFLLRLARHDRWVPAPALKPDKQVAFWSDLVTAAIDRFFKFQDDMRYPATIRKLATLESDDDDRKLVDTYQSNGPKYILHGKSTALRELRRLIDRVGKIDETVVITGETGTGKEHIAHLIHEASHRPPGLFVAINCALFAGNPELAYSTLFGHAKGAFTGADAPRKGGFEEANGGILFLDELAHLPISIQAMLLRVVEEHKVTPLGQNASIGVDVRILAATNRDLSAMVREGKFLEDLFHRLDTLRIHVPPLRNRLDDIAVIVAATLQDLKLKGYLLHLSPGDQERLATYPWPGNVRQLIKFIQRMAYLDLGVALALEEERRHVPNHVGVDSGQTNPLWPATAEQVQPMAEVQRRYAQRALALNGGNQAATRRALGVNHANTLKKIIAGKP